MNTPFSLDGFVLLLHLMITSVRLCAAARGVLNSHDTNGNTPLNLSVENLSFPLAVLADSPEKRHAEGYSVEQILVVSLLVGLLIYLIFIGALIVIRQTGACARLWLRFNMQPAFAKISNIFSRYFRSPSTPSTNHIPSFFRTAISQMVALSLRYTIRYIRRNGLPAASDALVLPLHQRDDTPPSLPLERAASPAPPPRVLFHDPHEPHRVSFQSPRPSPSSALAHNASQYSLAVSEATCWSAESDAATMVAEPIPGRGFL